MPLMNSHIVEECLPFTSLRLDPEDINLSMGAGYVPDAEIQAISDALETEIAGICTPRFLYALFDAEPAGTCEVGVNGISLKTGSVITPYLKDAAGYVLFVATAGYEFEAFQHRIGSQGDILREFLLDAYGSAIAEAVVREVCRKVECFLWDTESVILTVPVIADGTSRNSSCFSAACLNFPAGSD